MINSHDLLIPWVANIGFCEPNQPQNKARLNQTYTDIYIGNLLT